MTLADRLPGSTRTSPSLLCGGWEAAPAHHRDLNSPDCVACERVRFRFPVLFKERPNSFPCRGVQQQWGIERLLCQFRSHVSCNIFLGAGPCLFRDRSVSTSPTHTVFKPSTGLHRLAGGACQATRSMLEPYGLRNGALKQAVGLTKVRSGRDAPASSSVWVRDHGRRYQSSASGSTRQAQ